MSPTLPQLTDARLTLEGRVATLILDRHDVRNALTGTALADDIVATAAWVNRGDDVSVLVITGEGSAFSAGGNVKDMASRGGDFAGDVAELAERYRRGIQRMPLALQAVEVPIIAAVNGTAAGVGAHLALCCDLVIMAEHAKFIEVFARRGLVPDGLGCWILPRLVGLQKAKELVFFADDIPAARAEAIGLCNKVVPGSELQATAKEWAERLAAGPTKSFMFSKWLINRSLDVDRRTIIEEAAGITKFRVRQRATEARLESARANLSRISDIVAEIDRQVNSLRRQAAKARRYGVLREELKDLLRRVYIAEDAKLSALLAETRTKLHEITELESDIAQELATRETDARVATQEARNLEDKLSAARAAAAEAGVVGGDFFLERVEVLAEPGMVLHLRLGGRAEARLGVLVPQRVDLGVLMVDDIDPPTVQDEGAGIGIEGGIGEGDELVPVAIGGDAPDEDGIAGTIGGLDRPCPDKGLIEEVLFVPVRRLHAPDYRLSFGVESAPPEYALPPLTGDFRKHVDAGPHVFAPLCVVR